MHILDPFIVVTNALLIYALNSPRNRVRSANKKRALKQRNNDFLFTVKSIFDLMIGLVMCPMEAYLIKMTDDMCSANMVEMRVYFVTWP